MEGIQECSEDFYRELYSRPCASEENCTDVFLSSLDLPILSGPQNEDLIKPISVEEVNAVLLATRHSERY